jgi:hypothetical protein
MSAGDFGVLRTAPRSYSRAPVAACDSRVFGPGAGALVSFCCLATGLSASAHQVEHDRNHTGVVFLKQANDVLPEAP